MEGKNEIQTVFCYKGADITFQNNDGSIMVNATEMAKQFGKRTVDWTRQKSSENFMRKLGEVRNLTSADMIRVVHGDGGCTWMHEDVALEFARWLSPEFAIWCNDRIKELLKFGITATQTTIENIIADPESGIRMLQALKSEREMRKRLEAEKQQQQLQINQQNQQILALSSEIESMQPKVSYYDKILANKSTVLVTSIALDYGMAAAAFNKILFQLRIQHKVGEQWILYAPYLSQGYVHSKPVEITHKDGRKSIKYNTEWTQKGRLFLYDILKQNNILPLIEQE